MAEEFSSELPEHELSTLMSRIGLRFARERRLPECDSLSQVEMAVNHVWDAEQWGECRLLEQPQQVDIVHAGAPINVALPDAGWSDGFLQGVYQGWFQQLGMSAGLAVHVGQAESVDLRRFVLVRAV